MSGAAETLIELYGTAAPPVVARVLTAGRLSVALEAGNLRYLGYGGTEILRAVAFVVRDRDWGTYAPVIADLEVTEGPDAFTVAYTAVCRGPSVLRYRARIEGRADGALRFAAEAVPEGDFETNRCGFVVLHPAAAAGAAATVEHCDGSREATAFPELIDPWRPFLSIREITHRAGGLKVTCRLEGEEFEMEDQRNWSDASFKTYGRPLELPWPFVLPAGVPIAQSVAVSVRRAASAAPAARAAEEPVVVEIGGPAGAGFPEVGLVVTAAEVPAALAALDRLAEIGPQRLLCAFDPTAGDGPAAFAAFGRLQQAFPAAAFDLECVVVGEGDLGEELAGVARAVGDAGLRLATVAVCPSVDRKSTPPGSEWPACPPLEDIYAAARAAFPGVTLGGGMFSYFTELNRKRPPVALTRLRHACDQSDRACRRRRQRDGDAGGAAAHHPLDADDHRRPAVPDRAVDDRDAAEPLRRAHDAQPARRAHPDGGRRSAPARALRRRLDRGLRRGDRAGGRRGLGAGGLHRGAWAAG